MGENQMQMIEKKNSSKERKTHLIAVFTIFVLVTTSLIIISSDQGTDAAAERTWTENITVQIGSSINYTVTAESVTASGSCTISSSNISASADSSNPSWFSFTLDKGISSNSKSAAPSITFTGVPTNTGTFTCKVTVTTMQTGSTAMGVTSLLCKDYFILNITVDQVKTDYSIPCGTQEEPLSSLTATALQIDASNQHFYVRVGASVSITPTTDTDSYYRAISGSGCGLSCSNGTISGTLTQAGTVTCLIGLWEPDTDELLKNYQFYIHAIESSTVSYVQLYFSTNNSAYGTVSPSTVENVPVGSTVSVSGNTITIKNGSTTIGTVTAKSKSGTDAYNYSFSSWSGVTDNQTISNNIYITAYFSKTATSRYTITVNSNDSSYGSVSPTQITDIVPGSSYTVSGNVLTITHSEMSTKTCVATPASDTSDYQYSFLNWSSISGTVNSNITITANFDRISLYTVTFTVSPTEYGSVSPSSISVPQGTAISESGNTLIFSKSGIDSKTVTANPASDDSTYSYQFSGWSLPSTSVNENMSVMANFTRQYLITGYTVSFVTDGGSECEDMTARPSVVLPSTEKSGFKFTGWYLGTEPIGVAGQMYSPGADVTLTAHWYQITSATKIVSFNTNGGTACDEIETTGEITLPSTAKIGSTLLGWYTALAGGELVGKSGESYAPDTSIILYAHWSSWDVIIKGPYENYTFSLLFYQDNDAKSNVTASVDWYLDGESVHSGSDMRYQLSAEPSVGKHTIRVVATITNSTFGAIEDELVFSVTENGPEPLPDEPENNGGNDGNETAVFAVIAGLIVGMLVLVAAVRVF